MAKMVIDWDEEALKRALGHDDNAYKLVKQKVDEMTSRANAMASDYESRGFYKKGELVGGHNTPKYEGIVDRLGKYRWPYGIVHNANRAAYMENLEHNTLSKVM